MRGCNVGPLVRPSLHGGFASSIPMRFPPMLPAMRATAWRSSPTGLPKEPRNRPPGRPEAPDLVRSGTDLHGSGRMTITRVKLERFTAFESLDFRPSPGVKRPRRRQRHRQDPPHEGRLCRLRREQDGGQLRGKARPGLHAVRGRHRAPGQAAPGKFGVSRRGLPRDEGSSGLRSRQRLRPPSGALCAGRRSPSKASTSR